MSKNQLPERKDIPQELTWDLTCIYPDEAAWENDFGQLDELQKNVNRFAGHLADSAVMLRDAIQAMDALERKLEKLYTYSHLRHDEDTGNAAGKSLYSRICSRASQIAADCAWFEPELLAIDDARIAGFMDSDELSFYKESIQELLRGKKYTLSEKEERILGALSDVLGAPDDIYETLTTADMRLPFIKDQHGKKLELTSGNYRKYIESPDRKVRKRAFKGMFNSYKNIIHSCAATLENTVKRHVVTARLRSYDSALHKALFADELPEKLYHNLIESVHRSIPALTGYLKLRQKVLKLKKADMYDLYNPLVKQSSVSYTYEQAQNMVLEAVAVMGSEYQSVVQRAFDERWIDVMECRRKRSGAYSSGCYDTAPYILLNFNGTLNDVFTLAHEMGHSMHSYFSRQNQDFHYADYPIFAAEIASTTNELLLHDYLMKKYADNADMQITLLVHLIDEVRACIYRQTMFAEFELHVHQLQEQDIPLTADKLCDDYYELNNRYYGDAIKANDLIRYEWARIPHFYYNFYVFKYATGLAAAMKFARNILSGDPLLLEKYCGFLKAGGSAPVLDILQTAGVDFVNANVVDDALEDFSSMVKQLKKLLK
ncbi:MAG: oligoendopeptidase F [Lentisphaerae bacterium]|nr:oligoendopeptidase F [Lentisphaerota bacterium]